MGINIKKALILLLVIIPLWIVIRVDAEALKCYMGFKIIDGQPFGGDESKTCDDESDYCYNATARTGGILNLGKAGCSTYRCFLARDTCFNTELGGIPVSFCCCSTNYCNGRDRRSEKDNLASSLLGTLFN